MSVEATGSLKKIDFIGIALGGGKTSKTCISIVEYYPKENKIFLRDFIANISTQQSISGDLQIHQLIMKWKADLKYVAINAPLEWPKCVRCQLKCPGYEECHEDEIQWLWNKYLARNEVKRPKKLFTPYTERCVEFQLATELEETFHPPHALGANAAPLASRAQFIKRRLKAVSFIEIYPKLSLWRIGQSLGISKSHLRTHRNSVDGEEARRSILKRLMEKKVAFIYTQDILVLESNPEMFDAFLCGLTAVLHYKKQCEKRPKGFPKGAPWIQFPKQEIDW